jgi:hypothetical protein
MPSCSTRRSDPTIIAVASAPNLARLCCMQRARAASGSTSTSTTVIVFGVFYLSAFGFRPTPAGVIHLQDIADLP